MDNTFFSGTIHFCIEQDISLLNLFVLWLKEKKGQLCHSLFQYCICASSHATQAQEEEQPRCSGIHSHNSHRTLALVIRHSHWILYLVIKLSRKFSIVLISPRSQAEAARVLEGLREEIAAQREIISNQATPLKKKNKQCVQK